MRLEHIAITVLDENELNNFYHDILGFELKRTFELSEEFSGKIFGVFSAAHVNLMQKEDVAFEIFICPEANNLKYEHVCLSVKNREEMCEKAANDGYESVRIKRDISDLIFIKDKNQNVFELKQI